MIKVQQPRALLKLDETEKLFYIKKEKRKTMDLESDRRLTEVGT
jgi:hypothetical protein